MPKPLDERLKLVHSILGWMLFVAFGAIGCVIVFVSPLDGLNYIALAIAVCPRLEIPNWIRVLLCVIGFGLLS